MYGNQATCFQRGSCQNVYRTSDDVDRNADCPTGGASINILKVEVAHGSDRHSIELGMDHDIRVCDLQNEIARRTRVHPCNQRIYYRGQHLEHCPQSRLVDFHVFNNSSMTLVGYPPEKHNPQCHECNMCEKRASGQLKCVDQDCPRDPRRKIC